MSKSLSAEKRQEWSENIQKQRQSGLSIEVWCRQNNLAPHNFYYWRDKLFPKTLNRCSFSELKNEKASGIIIEYKNIRIHVEHPFNASLLKDCLEAIRELPC